MSMLLQHHVVMCIVHILFCLGAAPVNIVKDSMGAGMSRTEEWENNLCWW